jgi:hypothetical protein
MMSSAALFALPWVTDPSASRANQLLAAVIADLKPTYQRTNARTRS